MLIDGSTMHVWTSGVDHRPHTRRSCVDGISDPRCRAAGTSERLGDLPAQRRVDHEPRFSPDRPHLDQQLRRTLGQLPQPYSSNGSEFWSDYFPVTVGSPTEALNFLLTVRAVRWQARLSGPDGSPALEKVEIMHAPVSFSPTGSAVSTSIGPSPGRAVTAWRSLAPR